MVRSPHLRAWRPSVRFLMRHHYPIARLDVASLWGVSVADTPEWHGSGFSGTRSSTQHGRVTTRQRTLTLGLGTNTMRSSSVLSFVSGAALLAACGGNNTGPSNSPPTADFTAPTCTVNVSCSFAGTGTDSDGSVTGYSWDFGDQTAAVSGQNVTHTFATASTFQVKLTTTDNGGATGSVTKPVTVAAANQGPTAGFTVTCNGLDCSFTDTSTPAGSLTYQWDF